MPERKTIKISSIKPLKNDLFEIKVGSDVFNVDLNAYTDHLLFVGKELTESDINQLKNESRNSLLMKYALKIASSRRYSEFEMRTKLLGKGANKNSCQDLIDKLKEYSLIDDSLYASDYKEEKEASFYGKNRIIYDLLNKKKIDEKIVRGLAFSKEREIADKFVQLSMKSVSRLPLEAKKRKLFSSLERRGFEKDVIDDALSALSEDDTADSIAQFQKCASLALQKYERKYENKYDIKNHLYGYLRGKGYKSEMIEDFLEDNL